MNRTDYASCRDRGAGLRSVDGRAQSSGAVHVGMSLRLRQLSPDDRHESALGKHHVLWVSPQGSARRQEHHLEDDASLVCGHGPVPTKVGVPQAAQRFGLEPVFCSRGRHSPADRLDALPRCLRGLGYRGLFLLRVPTESASTWGQHGGPEAKWDRPRQQRPWIHVGKLRLLLHAVQSREASPIPRDLHREHPTSIRAPSGEGPDHQVRSPSCFFCLSRETIQGPWIIDTQMPPAHRLRS